VTVFRWTPAPVLALSVGLLGAAGCESDRDKAARMIFDARQDLARGDVVAALEKARKIEGWSASHFEELTSRARFYRTRYAIEMRVLAGEAAAADVDALVAAFDDPALAAWWEERGPILGAWPDEAPLVRVEFVDSKGEPAAWVDEALRRDLLAGLALNADGVAFETAVSKPKTWVGHGFPEPDVASGEPICTLPRARVAASAGRLLVQAHEELSAYQSENGEQEALLPTTLVLELALETEREASWTAQTLRVEVEPPSQISVDAFGHISESTAAAIARNLRELALADVEDLPPLRLE